MISRKEENPDDRTKARKKGGDGASGYRAGFTSSNAELLGFKTTKKYVEERPKTERREERTEEKKNVEETPATEETTTEAT